MTLPTTTATTADPRPAPDDAIHRRPHTVSAQSDPAAQREQVAAHRIRRRLHRLVHADEEERQPDADRGHEREVLPTRRLLSSQGARIAR